MKKGKKLYEGKAKIVYAAPDSGLAIQHFKDHATAFNNLKKSTIEGKGVLNNRISEHILTSLEGIGIKTHLVKRINMREQLIKLVDIIPIEFIIRNIWRLYGGWYDGQPSNLKPPAEASIAKEISSLIGSDVILGIKPKSTILQKSMKMQLLSIARLIVFV